MSLFIYQIGNVVFNIQSSNVQDLKLDLERKFRTGVTLSPFGTTTAFNNLIQLPDENLIRVSGTLTEANGKSPTDQLNELLSIAGRPNTPIIAYMPTESPSRPVVWLTTVGTVQLVKREVTLNDKLPSIFDALKVDLDIVLDTYWYPMNPYIWDAYYGVGEADSFRKLWELSLGSLPRRVQSMSGHLSNRVTFSKKNYHKWHLLYDPEIWATYDPQYYGLGGYWDHYASYRVAPGRRYWSAPPGAVYGYTNLPDSGSVTITVESEITPFETYTHTSTLDLSTLDAELNARGFTGLLPTDIVIATDGLHSPGFVIRDGDVLSVDGQPILPIWDMHFSSPGQLLGLDNYVTFSLPPNAQAAYLHTYRLL